MDKRQFSRPIDLGGAVVTDSFWRRAMELVRREVIPYQWEVLNDRVEGAAPSWCMHNFRAAARLMRARREQGAGWIPPRYTYRGFEALPEDPEHPEEDRFYGFVFQDTDFSKWIEAVGYALAAQPDDELERIADEAIDLVCAAQTDEGYLDTYYIINGMDAALTNLRDHHELYCLGHLIEGAIAYEQGTGKDKLLRAACRFADYMAERFGEEEGKCKGYPGHEIAEMALLRLYERTGEARYLRLALFFLNQRGVQPHYFAGEERERALREGKKPPRATGDYTYHQAHLPVREQGEAVGHAVRAVYLYAGMADAARMTGDEEMLAACRRLWESIVREKLYITGGIGATHMGEAFSYPFDLPNDSAYSETCAAIGLVFFARRMLQLEADSAYADVMELALFNTVLAGMQLDGKRFFYVNPLSVVPQACRRDARLAHVKPVRQKWFGCACCPPNIARLVSSVAQYAYTVSPDTLYIHLYMGGSAVWKHAAGEAAVQVEANLPFDGDVTLRIQAAEPFEGRLALRLPGWSDNPTVDAPGKRQTREKGYAYLEGLWHDGDVVTLRLPMPVRLLEADPRVRENIGKAAFMRGPLVFCCEEADNGPMLHLLRVDEQKLGPDCSGAQVTEADIGGHRTPALLVPGLRRVQKERRTLYARAVPCDEQETQIRLIPYYAWANRGEGEMTVWLRR